MKTSPAQFGVTEVSPFYHTQCGPRYQGEFIDSYYPLVSVPV